MFVTVTQPHFRHLASNIQTLQPKSLMHSTRVPLFSGPETSDQFEHSLHVLKEVPSHITALTPSELKLISQYQQVGTELDRGGYGITYLIASPGRSIVIKVPRAGKQTNFAHEADMLFRLPHGVPYGQNLEFWGMFRLNGKDILAMSFVDGQKFTPVMATPLNNKQLTSLMNQLTGLDMAHIYHADLKPSNLLLKPDQINLVDYGDAFKTNPSQHEAIFNPVNNIYAPAFAFLDNATNFQTRALPTHVHNILESEPNQGPGIVTQLFRDFLRQKAQGQATYIDFLRKNKATLAEPDSEQLKESLDYTNLQAKFLMNPSRDVLVQQAWKTEALFCSTMSGRQAAFSNNLEMAYQWAILAKEATRQYQQITETLSQQEQQKAIPNASGAKDYQRFLDYERRFGEFIQQGIEETLVKEPKTGEVKKSSAPPMKPQLLLAPTIRSMLQNQQS